MQKLLIVALSCTVVFLAILLYNSSEEANRYKRWLEEENKQNPAKMGWNIKYGSYNLRSFDGGKNWYAIEYTHTPCGGFKIKGPAEEIFPGLLSHLEAWDKLIERAKKTGPLNPNHEADRKVLEDAGLKVEPKK